MMTLIDEIAELLLKALACPDPDDSPPPQKARTAKPATPMKAMKAKTATRVKTATLPATAAARRQRRK